MEHLNMHTPDITESNILKIGELFPNCLTERISIDGKVESAIDFDMLRQELSKDIVESPTERYQFTWPEKRKAIRLANAPTNMTLRPCREESVDFDNTENLYIEGDNLEVLKLLRENYLGKVKMIYIDPPYNTGKDFVYADDYSQSASEYADNSGQRDELGNRLVLNAESNGRFHTDWLNMIYPRLKVAKDLLSMDGAVFISIGEEEIERLKIVCNEIFGESNFANSFIVRRYDKNLNRQFMDNGLKSFNIGFEYILCYTKGDFLFKPVFKEASEERQSQGYWKGFWNDANRPTMRYEILGFTPETGQWKWSKPMADEAVNNYKVYEEQFSDRMTLEEYWASTGKTKRFIRRNVNGRGKNAGVENWIAPADGILRNTNWLDFLASKNDPSSQGLFDFPKNVDVIRELLLTATEEDSLVFDFFSGSATTAHAVMQLNAEDGGNRRFIMVQLPEETDEKSEAYKAGYKNICEIGKERIRRAGKKILEEQKVKQDNLFAGEKMSLDIGFRVLKLDTSNMENVYYRPEESSAATLFDDNVKTDRTGEDLLFQVMLECNLPLSAKIQTETIAGKEVFSVNDGYLIACFDEKVNEDVIKEVAKRQPYYFVMRDSSLATDNVADNFEQIWKAYSKDTIRRII
ncbi:MAG: site-specific DNA-methyltransferase [Bacteroidales bacterium]|nr:site-specific DNA-methyltransferase [Bacteroidales bacterium]